MSTILSTPPIGHESIGRAVDGRFTLLRWLGETDQSIVFLTELEAGEKAAIKLMPADDVEAHLAQWETARILSHPHLMRLFAAGRCTFAGEDVLYVVTEYADEILSDILRQRSLTPEEAWEMLGPILETLSFLHGRNLLHGHLKPSNIMVVGDRLKLSADRLHYASQHDLALSSPDPYVAPDASGSGKISTAADIWSLGVVMVEALTQQPPPAGSRGRELVVPESVPLPFFDVARKCLRIDPARRPRLEEIRESLDPARVEDTDLARARQPRARMVIAGMLIVAVLMSTAMVIGAHRHSGPTVPPPSSAPSAGQPQPAATPTPHQAPAAIAQRPTGPVLKGEVVDRVTPDVPQHITDDIQGHLHVRIDVEVAADGNVANATIASQGPSQYFANRALAAARKWKFKPAEIGSSAVASNWSLEFIFSQDETTITPTETSP